MRVGDLELDTELMYLDRSIQALSVAAEGIGAAIDAELPISGSAVTALMDILLADIKMRYQSISTVLTHQGNQ